MAAGHFMQRSASRKYLQAVAVTGGGRIGRAACRLTAEVLPCWPRSRSKDNFCPSVSVPARNALQPICERKHPFEPSSGWINPNICALNHASPCRRTCRDLSYLAATRVCQAELRFNLEDRTSTYSRDGRPDAQQKAPLRLYMSLRGHLHELPGAFFVFRPRGCHSHLSIGALVKGGIVAPTKVYVSRRSTQRGSPGQRRLSQMTISPTSPGIPLGKSNTSAVSLRPAGRSFSCQNRYRSGGLALRQIGPILLPRIDPSSSIGAELSRKPQGEIARLAGLCGASHGGHEGVQLPHRGRARRPPVTRRPRATAAHRLVLQGAPPLASLPRKQL